MQKKNIPLGNKMREEKREDKDTRRRWTTSTWRSAERARDSINLSYFFSCI